MPEFKFSLPAITSLNDDQQLAYDPRVPMLITGGPGSGKTVVTIYRFLRAVLEKKHLMLFTYNRALIYSIKGTLRDRAEELFGGFDQAQIDKIVEEQLSTFYNWHHKRIKYFNADADDRTIKENFEAYVKNNERFDEIFFDEGQDLPRTVFSNAFVLSETLSVGADRAQNYRGHYKSDELEDIIFEGLKKQNSDTDRQYLETNYRNTKEIFEFAKEFVKNDPRVWGMATDGFRRGNNPEVRMGLSKEQQLEMLKEIIEANLNSNIGILVHSPEEITIIRQFLQRNDYSCANDAVVAKSFSYYYHKMSISDENAMKMRLSSPFITTFESCKGLEFDVVILPFFERSDIATTTINEDGRFKATPSHYYVAVTRAKNDFIILCDEKPKALSFYTTTINPDEDDDLPF
ncbi:3'-5' exonuclease [Pedobacter sp.]